MNMISIEIIFALVYILLLMKNKTSDGEEKQLRELQLFLVPLTVYLNFFKYNLDVFDFFPPLVFKSPQQIYESSLSGNLLFTYLCAKHNVCVCVCACLSQIHFYYGKVLSLKSFVFPPLALLCETLQPLFCLALSFCFACNCNKL